MITICDNLLSWIKKINTFLSEIYHRLDRQNKILLIIANLILYFCLFLPAFLEKQITVTVKNLNQSKAYSFLNFSYLSAMALVEGVIFFLILAGVYILFSYFFSTRKTPFNYQKIIGISLLIAAVILWVKPFMSEDILFYIFRGRVESVYGQNPYTVSYSTFPKDKFYHTSDYQVHKDLTSVYGPLFGYISCALTKIHKQSITWNIIIFKLFNVLLHLLNSFLIMKILSEDSQYVPKSDTLLYYCWHPLIILECLLNGHNDMLLISFLFILILCIKKGAPHLAFIFLSLGVLTKITPLILFPHYLIYCIHYNRRNKNTHKNLIVGLIISCALMIGISLPYFNSLKAVHGFLIHSSSLNLFQIVIKGLLDLPALFAAPTAIKIAKLISYLFFLVFYSKTLLHLWHNPSEKSLF